MLGEFCLIFYISCHNLKVTSAHSFPAGTSPSTNAFLMMGWHLDTSPPRLMNLFPDILFTSLENYHEILSLRLGLSYIIKTTPHPVL